MLLSKSNSELNPISNQYALSGAVLINFAMGALMCAKASEKEVGYECDKIALHQQIRSTTPWKK